jgi:hypothetical protein
MASQNTTRHRASYDLEGPNVIPFGGAGTVLHPAPSGTLRGGSGNHVVGILKQALLLAMGRVNKFGRAKITVISSPLQDGYFYHLLADFLGPSTRWISAAKLFDVKEDTHDSDVAGIKLPPEEMPKLHRKVGFLRPCVASVHQELRWVIDLLSREFGKSTAWVAKSSNHSNSSLSGTTRYLTLH